MTHRLPGFPAPPTSKAVRFSAKEKAALALLTSAFAAAERAGVAAKPPTMLVGTPKDVAASLLGQPDGGFDPEQPVYVVPDGPCGFAGVKIFPARGALVSALKKSGRGYANYGGGYYLPIHLFGQSLVRKEAAAYALADVLRAAGYTAYPDSRMD